MSEKYASCAIQVLFLTFMTKRVSWDYIVDLIWYVGVWARMIYEPL